MNRFKLQYGLCTNSIYNLFYLQMGFSFKITNVLYVTKEFISEDCQFPAAARGNLQGLLLALSQIKLLRHVTLGSGVWFFSWKERYGLFYMFVHMCLSLFPKIILKLFLQTGLPVSTNKLTFMIKGNIFSLPCWHLNVIIVQSFLL